MKLAKDRALEALEGLQTLLFVLSAVCHCFGHEVRPRFRSRCRHRQVEALPSGTSYKHDEEEDAAAPGSKHESFVEYFWIDTEYDRL